MGDEMKLGEDARQAVHALAGVSIMSILLFSGKSQPTSIAIAQFLLIIAFLLSTLAVNLKLKGFPEPHIDFLLVMLERKGARPLHGTFWFILGSLSILSFIPSFAGILASLYLLSVADAVSTVVGMRGTRKLFYNKKKTLEGTLAFFLAGLPAFIFIGPPAIALSALCALVESLPLRLDDNATVPLACIAYLRFLG